MRKPKAVRIKRRWIKINYTTELIDGKDVGEFDHTTRPMTITVFMNKDWQSTLFHEVLHCYLHISGWNKRMNPAYEEGLVSLLEKSFRKLKFNWRSSYFRY